MGGLTLTVSLTVKYLCFFDAFPSFTGLKAYCPFPKSQMGKFKFLQMARRCICTDIHIQKGADMPSSLGQIGLRTP